MMNGHIKEVHTLCYNPTCIVCELYICAVCGCIEGSLLPFCPGRRVTMAEMDKFYEHYCNDTGAFARCTRETATAARQATYVYLLRQGTLRAPTRGSTRLYAAVFELWKWKEEQP